ncbi:MULTISPECIES: hypothetical protein [unclassified Helicobacter]|uniref:hypothetical protein n=1 Tax=unclassified Helicobacter TaxID=2593540 RepID=UPI0013154F1E|nr:MULTISPECIES: hypothetical protein [unclassified Helicobacter]
MSLLKELRIRLKRYKLLVDTYRFFRYTAIVILYRMWWNSSSRFHNPMSNKEVLPCIISLTSFPARIKYVHYTLQSLIRQDKHPQKIILWLAMEQFPDKKLPTTLTKTISNKKWGKMIEIRWCRDLKSYKKLLPTLQLNLNLPIITVDDDIYYPKHWLTSLWESYCKFPMCISTHLAAKVELHVPVNSWNSTESKTPSLKHLAVGAAGVIYPPNCLHEDISDYEKITRLAPLADDLYFWSMAILNNTQTVVVDNSMKNLQKSISHFESPNLGDQNGLGGQNQIQLEKILEHYPQISKII